MNCKFFIMVLLFSGLSFTASAQLGELRRNFSIGANAGVNMNNVSFLPKIKQNSQLAYTGGVTARYISEKYFAMICGLQLELNYSQRGWEEELEGLEDEYSRTMNYIEMPLLAHLAFGREPRGLQFFLNLGPQIGFLLSEKERFSTVWDPTNRPNDVYEQYGMMAERKIDYGIVAGGGLELRTKAGNFLLEGRYYYGLSDFYNNSKKDIFSRSAHTGITIKMTYLFDLTKY